MFNRLRHSASPRGVAVVEVIPGIEVLVHFASAYFKAGEELHLALKGVILGLNPCPVERSGGVAGPYLHYRSTWPAAGTFCLTLFLDVVAPAALS